MQKFSSLNKHKFVIICSKNFDHCSIGLPAMAHFCPKLWMPLATVIVEIFLKEKNWGGFRLYLVTLRKEFEISLKNIFLKSFERVNCSGQFSGSWSSLLFYYLYLNLYTKISIIVNSCYCTMKQHKQRYYST